MQQIYSGLPAAPGVGIGTLFIYSTVMPLSQRHVAQGTTQPARERARFVVARQGLDTDLAHLAQVGNAVMSDIFLVHREILHDKTLTDAIRTLIDGGLDATTATQQAVGDLVRVFQNLSDEQFASRATDIRDVGQRLLARLDGTILSQQLQMLPPNTILVADDLTPFDTSHLSTENVTGIALAGSAPTAHTAILARSLGLPLICGLGPAVLKLPAGEQAIVDGIQGRLFVMPEAETLHAYEATRTRLRHFRVAAEAHTHEPAITEDGVRVPVRVNVNSREDVLVVSASGAEGVGLLRTEYLFQQRTTPPSVDEQVEAYREIAEHFPNQVFTVRLLDIGGDKPVQYLPQPAEANPFLGVRGIRLLLQQPALLQSQIEALTTLALENSVASPVRILVPMVSRINEIHRVLAFLEEIPNVARHRRPGGAIQVGMMIEVPAAALLADKFAAFVDFFSIGTNDLSQYTLAADRVNSAVATLASALDPSVLRLIAMTCQAGEKAGIPVTVCGEIAGDPSVAPLLLGLGVKELSVAAPSVALVKQAVRLTRMEEARHLAAQALQSSHAQEVHDLLKPAE